MTEPFDNGRRAADNTTFYSQVAAPSVKGRANLIRVSVYNDGTIGFGIGEEWRRFNKVAVQLTPDDVRYLIVSIIAGQPWEVVRYSTSRRQPPKLRRLRHSVVISKWRPITRLYFHTDPTSTYIEVSATLTDQVVADLLPVLAGALGAAT